MNEWLEKNGDRTKETESDFINNIVSATRDDVKGLKVIGVFDLAKAAMSVKDKGVKIKRRKGGRSLILV